MPCFSSVIVRTDHSPYLFYIEFGYLIFVCIPIVVPVGEYPQQKVRDHGVLASALLLLADSHAARAEEASVRER